MEIFIETHGFDTNSVRLPLPSCAVIYMLRYCQVQSVKVNLVTTSASKTITGPNDTIVSMKKSSLNGIDYTCMEEGDVPKQVQNCDLPVIQDEDGQMIRSGLCSCVRRLVSYASTKSGDKSTLELLGFRHGSLKACAEVSGWTKLCEIEIPTSIGQLMNILRSEKHEDVLEIPADFMKLELYLEQPPPLHNDDNKKRTLLQKVRTGLPLSDCTEPECEKVCSDLFKVREVFSPHGSMYYRVITKPEKLSRRFTNKSCKFGCTENKLVKWCAKCNDQEKDRQKEIKISKNKIRKDKLVNSDEVNRTDSECSKGDAEIKPGINGDSSDKGDGGFDLTTVEDLTEYVNSLTLYDIEYEHTYAEGVMFTIADIMLFVYCYHLLESMSFRCKELFRHIPLVHKWLKHLITLPRVQDAALLCGFDLKQLKICLNNSCKDSSKTRFTFPDGFLDVEDDNREITRRSRAKVRPLKNDIAKVLEKTEFTFKYEEGRHPAFMGGVQELGIMAETGIHPRGTEVQVDWDSVPFEVHPKIELPEKRVKRKCEQLENLATAVQEISKPGDVIVDFCSGGGHLGIIIAYLLPECTVYMVENNEDSLKRATERVKTLKLSNVVLYQCNLGYFRGHFDVGVCLHACGVATDMVLQQCIDRKASFVICPCCYGSIQNTHRITFPRSQYYREAEFTDKDVILLGHAADQTEINTDLQSQGRHCMNLVDTDRANFAKEYGYSVTLCSLQPLTCTTKNNLLIGAAPVELFTP